MRKPNPINIPQIGEKSIARRNVRSLQKSRNSFLQNSFVAWTLIILLSATDLASLYNTFARLVTDSRGLLILISSVTALLLELLPAIGGVMYQRSRRGRAKKWWIGPPIVAFVVLIVAVALLRFNTMELVFTSPDNTTSGLAMSLLEGTEIGVDTRSASTEIGPAQIAYTGFLCLMNLCTSVASFFLSIPSADPLASEIQEREKLAAALAEHIRIYEAVLEQLKKFDEAKALAEENQKTANHKALIRGEREVLSARAAEILARHIPHSEEDVVAVIEEAAAIPAI